MQNTTYVTLKRAAQMLGVHEQTLRRWERKGMIRMARLPHSGHRRVPLEEIERLQRSMAAPPPEPAVRLVPPRLDAKSQEKARKLSKLVRADLSGLESEQSFDEFMAKRRGRLWLP
ncbi:MAG: helix-turn-helix domain-containing protein [Chloroflexi bacterium]|nr:helix-turn-helix domain-containing protein [Chloroflexota bacterium]